MSIMMATQIPIVLILGLLYRKLGRLRKRQMLMGTAEPLPTSPDISGVKVNSGSEYSEGDAYSEGDEYSDEDAAELLLAAPKKTPLEGAI